MKIKTLLICFMFTITLVSCKKDHSSIDDTPKIGFTANNVQYQWNFVPGASYDNTDVFFRKTYSGNTNDPKYDLVGINQSAKAYIICAIHAPGIKEGKYISITSLSNPDVESICSLNDVKYGTITDDYMVVTISKIEGNYASGTFDARMHDLSTGTKELNIINGYFNHVAISE